MVVIEQSRVNRLQLDKSIVDQDGWNVFPGTTPPMIGKAIAVDTGKSCDNVTYGKLTLFVTAKHNTIFNLQS